MKLGIDNVLNLSTIIDLILLMQGKNWTNIVDVMSLRIDVNLYGTVLRSFKVDDK